MHRDQLYYLPLPLPFFAVLVGIFLVVAVLLQIGALRYVYMRLGVGPGGAFLLLLGSLLGSYFNVPLTELPGRRIISGDEIEYFGMRYAIPVVVAWPGTVLAVNVGGALIPAAMSLYLYFKCRLWVRGVIAIGCVAAICHVLAQPVPGFGIALPVFVPAATTAIVALLLAPGAAAPLAYIAGSIGTLIGADLLNLGRIQDQGAPVASIGGAGTFDGIFLTGILAVLLASIAGPPRRRDRSRRGTQAAAGPWTR